MQINKLILIISGPLISLAALAQEPTQEPTPAVALFHVVDKEIHPIIDDNSEAATQPVKTGNGNAEQDLDDPIDRKTMYLPFTIKVEKTNPNIPLDVVIFKIDGIEAKIDKVYPYTLTIGEEWKLKEGDSHLLEVTPVALIKRGKENVAVSGKTISWTFLTPDLPTPTPIPTPIEEEKKNKAK